MIEKTVRVTLAGRDYNLTWDTILALRSARYDVRAAAPKKKTTP